MHSLLKLSEGAAISLHAADYMAQRGGLCSAVTMAKDLGVSYNHLSKVLQQLTRAGLVTAARGPKGGFALSPAGKKASVGDFLSVMDGKIGLDTCLMGDRPCRMRECMLGHFLEETSRRFETILTMKVSKLAGRK